MIIALLLVSSAVAFFTGLILPRSSTAWSITKPLFAMLICSVFNALISPERKPAETVTQKRVPNIRAISSRSFLMSSGRFQILISSFSLYGNKAVNSSLDNTSCRLPFRLKGSNSGII
ncbi:hypothetical protein [Treponema sp. R80B11-R83G3]